MLYRAGVVDGNGNWVGKRLISGATLVDALDKAMDQQLPADHPYGYWFEFKPLPFSIV